VQTPLLPQLIAPSSHPRTSQEFPYNWPSITKKSGRYYFAKKQPHYSTVHFITLQKLHNCDLEDPNRPNPNLPCQAEHYVPEECVLTRSENVSEVVVREAEVALLSSS
jgi:hypothetical protein